MSHKQCLTCRETVEAIKCAKCVRRMREQLRLLKDEGLYQWRGKEKI